MTLIRNEIAGKSPVFCPTKPTSGLLEARLPKLPELKTQYHRGGADTQRKPEAGKTSKSPLPPVLCVFIFFQGLEAQLEPLFGTAEAVP
jgi:hypothetical protein